MGWTHFYGRSFNKSALTEYLKNDPGRLAEGFKMLAYRVVGSNFWSVVERTRGDGSTSRAICLTMMRPPERHAFCPADGWGYKDLHEGMGPREVNCPLAFLKEVPQPAGEFAARWRGRVRDHHKQAAMRGRLRSRAKRGDVVELDGERYELAAPRVCGGRKSGWYVNRLRDGQRFRMSPAMLGRALAEGVQ